MQLERFHWGATLLWLGRIGLIAVLALALVGVINPELRPTEIAVRPDQVSHALIIYGVTLLAALSFPRIKPLWLALFFAAIAGAVELAQLSGVLSGSAHIGDLLADAFGIIAALVPIAVVRARRIARAEGA